MTQLRFYIFDRFANRAGLVLSWGHNQLIRTNAVQQAGGFCESITPEDSSLSLELSRLGYSIRLVNVISHDTDPSSIFSFTRRISRWAGQTAEVFSMPWNGASLRLKLLLCYHLYTYTIQNIYLILLIYTAWSFDSRGISPMKLFEFANTHAQSLSLWTLVLVEMTLLWLLQLLLRYYLGRRAGISFKKFFEHIFLSTALNSFASLAIDISIFHALIGIKTDFIPTNVKGNPPVKQLLHFAKDMLFWFIMSAVILLGMSLRNNLLFFGLNGLWIFLWVITPFTLLIYHRDQLA